ALAEIFSDYSRAFNHRLELAEGALPREVLHPAVGRHHEPLRFYDRGRPSDALRDALRGLHLFGPEIEDAEDDLLVGHVAEYARIQIRLSRLEREVRSDTI